MKRFFITATDTDAGKTFVAQLLTKSLVNKGYRVAVYKPISAGCNWLNGELVNEDAALLLEQANCNQVLSQINPIAFEEPIAPHIAAQLRNKAISLEAISRGFDDLAQLTPDIIITEGAGGWRLPLGQGLYLSDFAKNSTQKVILVVNMKLGCLNHAMLTYESIINDGLDCLGWIANCQSDMPYLQENISELTSLIQSPLLAVLPFEQNIEQLINHINLSTLID